MSFVALEGTFCCGNNSNASAVSLRGADGVYAGSEVSIEEFALDCIADPLVIANGDQRFDFVNRSFLSRFGEVTNVNELLDLLWDPSSQRDTFLNMFSSSRRFSVTEQSSEQMTDPHNFIFMFYLRRRSTELSFGSDLNSSGDSGMLGEGVSRHGIYRARVHFHRYKHGPGVVLTFKEITRSSFVGTVVHTRRASVMNCSPLADANYVAVLRHNKYKFLEQVALTTKVMSCCIEADSDKNTITRLWCNTAFANHIKMHPDDVVGTRMTSEDQPGLSDLIAKLSQISDGAPLILFSPTSIFASSSSGDSFIYNPPVLFLDPSPLASPLTLKIEEGTEYMITIHLSEVDNNSNVRRYVTYTSDDTQELKKLVQEREDQLLMMNTIFENHSIVMAAVDVDFERKDFTFVVANDALTSYFPEFDEKKSLVGAHAADLQMSEREISLWIDQFRIAKESSKTVKHEVQVRDRLLDISVVYVPGSTNRFVYFAQDISETRRLQEDLRKKKENLEDEVSERTKELEMALQVKTRFLATMSHEIRTPLFGIMGTLTLLGEKHLDPKALEMLRIAAVCGEQLLVVINDVLDFSKTEENKMEVEANPFSLQQVIQDAMELVSADPLRKSVEIVYDYYNSIPNQINSSNNHLQPSELTKVIVPDNIVGDMTRVLVNLFTNAVKFSISGAIVLRVTSNTTDDGFTLIEISVEDSGIGVGVRTKDRIFQPFVQEDISTTRRGNRAYRYGGSGLGLSISKRLCELMGGNMWFDSIEGKGSTFYFTIRVKSLKNVDELERITRPGHISHIALCIQNDTLGNLMTALEGQKRDKEGPGKFDLLMVDQSFLVAEVEENTVMNPDDVKLSTASFFKIKIVPNEEIILTAAKMLNLPTIVLINGRTTKVPEDVYHVTKPVRTDHLHRIVTKALKIEPNPTASKLKPSVVHNVGAVEIDPGTISVLVAEDNGLNQKVIRRLLESIGFKDITMVWNGKEALDILHSRYFDIVLMDVMMPVMGGIESTEKIRKEVSTQPGSIIGLTADAFDENKQLCLAAGMDFFLTKPINRNFLWSTIQDMIKRKKAKTETADGNVKGGNSPTTRRHAGDSRVWRNYKSFSLETRMKVLSLVLVALFCGVAHAGCPPQLKSCGDACYSDSLYCCVNNVLTQKSFCSSSTGGSTTSGGNTNNNCPYKTGSIWTGWNLYDQFNFFTAGDPTHGFVQFVDRNTATNSSLVSVNGKGQAYMGVDVTNIANNGRRAIRLESKNQYREGLYILDLAHMPGSVCGTWPAFWTVGDDWPNNGEIDIIEGVNKGDTNAMTLHTNAGCSLNGQSQSGRTMQSNCDVVATGNAGCGVQSSKANSYGDNFNRNGGGIYVMERTSTSIRIWNFPRNSIPADLLSNNPNPCSWGQPDGDYPLGGSCPASHFGAHRIVFDITFCGDWAGAVFGQQCQGNCVDFVKNNPAAFKETYWLINSLRFFTK
ncbi:putative endo-1,3(4)-beta-glucanase [Planoprotostelium fungivorum]|uniref:Putative endo-1,3(4)-beta-glucanase n=1 Tax=Planoprotostelium fungivorum TaxID=1890364 RepID=A0A2P6N0Y9_9EUKA|nr:putative endo-1,3(4)-beta-glucanase [Planoprotostelium fungivorum]